MGEIPLLNDHFQRWTGRLFSAKKSRRLENKKWYNLPLSPMALQYLYSFRKFPGYILAKCAYIYIRCMDGNVYVCICKNMRSQLLWHPLVWYTPFYRVGQPNNPPIHKSEVSLNKDPKWHLHTFALTYIYNKIIGHLYAYINIYTIYVPVQYWDTYQNHKSKLYQQKINGKLSTEPEPTSQS